MRITTYTYPWDLERLGVEKTLKKMADDGIQVVDLASAYHPIDSLSPREGASYFSDARGAVYFPARSERYGYVKPKLHSQKVCAVWPEAARVTKSLGLGLNAWTITLFQPWMRDLYPECARVLPSGDSSGSDVCAANPHVRDYVGHLCDDAVDQFGADMVRLEGVMPQLYDLDWLRPRTIVDVSPIARTLLNLCFCPSCISSAKASGIDAERVRDIVNQTVDLEISEGQTEESANRAGELSANAELRSFAANHVQSSIDLARHVRERLSGRAKISTNASTPYGGLLGAQAEDALLRQFIDVADQIAMHPANPNGNARIAALIARADSKKSTSMLFARIKAPGPAGGAQQEGGADAQLAKDLKEAAERNADEITLYTYGLMRDRDVEQFVSGVRRAFPLSGAAG